MTLFSPVCRCHPRSPVVDARRSGRRPPAANLPPGRQDPTGTFKIRRAFAIDFEARLQHVQTLTRELVVQRDTLGMNQHMTIMALNTPGNAQGRIEAFSKWFGNAVKTIIVAHEGHWVEPYVTTAYRKGAWDAARLLGPSVRPPMDPGRIATFLALARNEVDGLADELERQVVREGGTVLAAGKPARELMRVVADRVQKIGVVRAKAIVNVTVVSAHANASLDTYANAGLKQVGLKPEFVPVKLIKTKDAVPPSPIGRTARGQGGRFISPDQPRRDPQGQFAQARFAPRTRARLSVRQIVEISTAGDEAVCDECLDLEANNPYSIEEATGLIPAHPNCRCAWVPAGEYEPDVTE